MNNHLRRLLLPHCLILAFFLCGCAVPALSSFQPAPSESPHLYGFRPEGVLHQIHQQYPTAEEGYLTRDPSHASILYHEYSYTDSPYTSHFDSGKISRVQDPNRETKPPGDLLKYIPNCLPDESPAIFDDAQEIVATYCSLNQKIRLRNTRALSAILCEISSPNPPQNLFALPDRLLLVTGPTTISQMKLTDAPGLRPNGPRHLFILRRTAAGLKQETDQSIPATEVLDVDPWSDQILAEELVWIGWSPILYGLPVWQRNRFLFDLKTSRRTDLPLISGQYNLPDAFFLQSNPFTHR